MLFGTKLSEFKVLKRIVYGRTGLVNLEKM